MLSFTRVRCKCEWIIALRYQRFNPLHLLLSGSVQVSGASEYAAEKEARLRHRFALHCRPCFVLILVSGEECEEFVERFNAQNRPVR